jgi:hypothetical protein
MNLQKLIFSPLFFSMAPSGRKFEMWNGGAWYFRHYFLMPIVNFDMFLDIRLIFITKMIRTIIIQFSQKLKFSSFHWILQDKILSKNLIIFSLIPRPILFHTKIILSKLHSFKFQQFLSQSKFKAVTCVSMSLKL